MEYEFSPEPEFEQAADDEEAYEYYQRAEFEYEQAKAAYERANRARNFHAKRYYYFHGVGQ